jgi:site-specific DNA-methyltransferase (adenine-specific)
MVLASSPENGIVLDPFMGSGTTALASLKHNRKYIGIDLNQKYVDIALKRLENLDKDNSEMLNFKE